MVLSLEIQLFETIVHYINQTKPLFLFDDEPSENSISYFCPFYPFMIPFTMCKKINACKNAPLPLPCVDFWAGKQMMILDNLGVS